MDVVTTPRVNRSGRSSVIPDMGSATVDEAMLRALWDEHAGPLLAFARHLTSGDQARAEDLVQETLLRAWQHPEAVDPARGPLRPWLLTVARRVAIDQQRARRARPLEVDDAVLETHVVDDDPIDRAIESWLISDALASLTPSHREVLLETYYVGRTVAEAAAVLGIPEGTVKSRTFYALRAMKLALEERQVPL
ncbi:MAG: polymerase sigma-70 factor, subfamily [Actinomycetota bacterium]|jgi:RNA polymerase sigma-70 factor (ECF subfamily)|nr:polymerase sigma-70 factor, subfamily [Actinomycetota bacterium]